MTPEDIMAKARTLMASKAADYTKDPSINRYENFERSSLVASWFENDIDKAFTILIGTKLARLATLLNSENKPKNESIEDSFIDLVNYCALWAGKRLKPSVGELEAILNIRPKEERQMYDGVAICSFCNKERKVFRTPNNNWICSDCDDKQLSHFSRND